jgi:hypothetical protein
MRAAIGGEMCGGSGVAKTDERHVQDFSAGAYVGKLTG